MTERSRSDTWRPQSPHWSMSEISLWEEGMAASSRKEDLGQWVRHDPRGRRWTTGVTVSYSASGPDFSPTKRTDSILERGNPRRKARARWALWRDHQVTTGLGDRKYRLIELRNSERKGNSLRQFPSYVGALSNHPCPASAPCKTRIPAPARMLSRCALDLQDGCTALWPRAHAR